jgi:predicted metalloendopeptidase
MQPIRSSAVYGRALLATLLFGWPLSSARAQSSYDQRPSTLEAGVDSSIAPGDDFFAYANGAWLKSARIPAGMTRWGPRNEIAAVTSQRLATLLDDANAAPAGSLARKVADLRAAYLDEAAIEEHDLTPLRPMLDSIAQVHDRNSLTRLLGRDLGADVDPLNWGIYRSSHLMGLSVEESIHGERDNVPFLLQGGLGLPEREYYLSTDPKKVELRDRYREYVGHLLTLAGFDHGDQRAVAVVALETALAQREATPEASARDRNADTLWTRADFAREAPGMDWSLFFASAGLARQATFVPWQPTAVRGLAALVASQPVAVWQDYLRFHLLDRYADVLPRAFADEAQTLRTAVAGSATSPRADRALALAQRAMSDAIGQLYAERYFPADQKARVRGIVDNVRAAFTRRVEGATWMSPATKQIALTKVRTLYVGVGFPERWPDYSDLTIDRRDPVGDLRRIDSRNYRHALARLGHPVDRTEWWIAPQTVGAVLIFQLNAYDFSAALMQAPKYDPAASDAAAYGAIGAIIGHDVTHYIDRLGADYDTTGAMRHWWSSGDSLRFEALAAPLVDQFSAYHPFPDLAVDGKVSETENIADLGGLVAAFDAYRHSLGERARDTAYVRRQDREFFLAFAQSWRVALGESAMRTAATADHAPEPYRVSTVRNLDAWYDAFGVRPGQRLYLAPSARVRVW